MDSARLQTGSWALPDAEDVLRMERQIGPLPVGEIEASLKAHGIDSVDPRGIPQRFTKFFALMDVVSGGLNGKSVIDFGCGLGVFVSQASKLGMSAEGVDDFSEYGGRCQEAASCIASCMTPGRLPKLTARNILDGGFDRQVDFVTSFGMLEHVYGVEARERILASMLSSLKPGGTLILVCGPDKRFPVDFFHYGPTYLFYHCLPVNLRKIYLRLFAGKGRNRDPRWLSGMSVDEIYGALSRHGGVSLRRLFPLWVELSRTRILTGTFSLKLPVKLLSRLLVWLKAEPAIIVVARKSEA